MNKKRYKRHFIILENEDKGFQNKQGKRPKGYTKIEEKNGRGVLNHHIQNLIYSEQGEYIYRGYLIGTKNGKNIFVNNGTFLIDKNGNGELNWSFNVENVDGKGNPITAYNVIAIVEEPSNKNSSIEVKSPLVGFIDKEKVPWKHVLENKKKEEKSKIEKKKKIENVNEEEKVTQEVGVKAKKGKRKKEVELKEVESKEVEPKEVEPKEVELKEVELKEVEPKEVEPKEVEPKEVELKEVEPKEVEPKEVEPKEAELKEVETKEVETKEVELKEVEPKEIESKEVESMQQEVELQDREIEELENYEEECEYDDFMDYREEQFYNHMHVDKYSDEYIGKVHGYIEHVLEAYKEVKPFEIEIENCTWKKITTPEYTRIEHFPFYDFIDYMDSYVPYESNMVRCTCLINKYEHYMMGIKSDINNRPEYYLYAIPGRLMESEQPHEGETGFVYWHSIENKAAEKGDYGYWILHINAKTGKVERPLKTRIPYK